MYIETIRQWLNEAGFNWDKGKIVYQAVCLPCRGSSILQGKVVSAELIKADNEILDREFDSGYGGAECPRFIAEDDTAFYFPDHYDGATGLVKVEKDISKYLDTKLPTPYPGGGD